MLERLDQVDWARLSHAYGPATDVPELLREVASGGPPEWEAALGHLVSSIAHQGTVYDATPPAVPFLIELLDADTARARAVLDLLGWLAQGTGEELDVQATRAAVLEGLPLYLTLLQDPRSEIRLAVLFVLAAGTERLAEVETALLQAIAKEEMPRVKAGMVVGLTRLWMSAHQPPSLEADGSQRVDLLAGLLAEREPGVVRLAAALGLVQLGLEPAVNTCWSVLRECAGAGLVDYPDPPWSVHQALQDVVKALESSPSQRRELLTQLFRHSSFNVRSSVIYLAAQVCREELGAAHYFVPFYAELLGDPDERMREQSLQIMLHLGSAPALASAAIGKAALAEPLPHVRSLALRLLGKLGEARAIPAVQAMLADPQTRLNGLTALETFEPMGPQLEPLGPILRELLREGLDSYWCNVIQGTLAAIGPAASPAAADLAALLDSPSEFVRRHAARALGRIGPAARAFVSAVVARLDDPDNRVCAQAALAVWQMDGRADLAARTLLDILALQRVSGSFPSHYWGTIDAAEFIVLLEPPVKEAVPHLRRLLRHGLAVGRVRAACSLWKLEGQADGVLPALLGELKRTPAGILALKCLEEMGPAAAAAAPQLRRSLETDRIVNDYNDMGQVIELDESFRSAATRVLSRLSPTAT